MLVYGDAKRLERADMLCAEIASRLQAAQHLPAGIERHTELVAILLRAGELVQGLADLELAQMGADEISASRQTGECLLLDLAGLVARSWRQGFAGPVVVPARVARSLANSQAPLSSAFASRKATPSMLFTRRAISRPRQAPGFLPTRW